MEQHKDVSIKQVIINPYNVGQSEDKEIDYDKIIDQFGCSRIGPQLLEKVYKLTGRKPHRFLRRGIFFTHRDLDILLDKYQKGQPFFIYTGRGPSSQSLHLGHMIPFIFTKYLQQVFNVPLVIQISDDQKYFHKGKGKQDVQDYLQLGHKNVKDVIACGFDIQKTFIFSNFQYMGHMYKNVCRFQKHINLNSLTKIFGLENTSNCGMTSYPAAQAAPSLSSSFQHIFGQKHILCLIPQGIDQDPYFRMTRDVCSKLKLPKPCCIHSKFFPSLKGYGFKMSASDPESGIFLTDTDNQIRKKVNGAVSGGQITEQEQRQKGANIEIDIACKYLQFFLQSDQQLQTILTKYKKGEMLSSQIKKILADILIDLVNEHKKTRQGVSDKIVQQFMKIRHLDYYNQSDDSLLADLDEQGKRQFLLFAKLVYGQMLDQYFLQNKEATIQQANQQLKKVPIVLKQTELAILLSTVLMKDINIQKFATQLYHYQKSKPPYQCKYLKQILTPKQKPNKAFKHAKSIQQNIKNYNGDQGEGLYMLGFIIALSAKYNSYEQMDKISRSIQVFISHFLAFVFKGQSSYSFGDVINSGVLFRDCQQTFDISCTKLDKTNTIKQEVRCNNKFAKIQFKQKIVNLIIQNHWIKIRLQIKQGKYQPKGILQYIKKLHKP